MDPQISSPGTPQQSGSRLGFPSLSRWWPRRWLPSFLSVNSSTAAAAPSSCAASPLAQHDSLATFEVDDGGSAPGSPALSAYAQTSNNGVSCFTVPASHPAHSEGAEASEGHRFASITPTTVSATAGPSLRLATPTAGAAFSEGKSARVPSSLSVNGTSGVSVAADSSANTTPRLPASAASTPLLLTPLAAPLSAEAPVVKPRAMMGGGGGVGKAGSSAVPAASGVSGGNQRGAAAFLLPAAMSVSDSLAEEQRRTPPACVELPGPQSLFIRSGAASGCDSRSIGLLQRSVLAEQHAFPH